MTEGNAKGSCLCGEVVYEITGNLGIFQYCHCSRCRKFTGSAHASNLLVSPDQFRWLKGESLVGRYAPEETKHFATSFCQKCGSSLPWHTKSGKAVVVPAGTLDEHPGIEPFQNVFCASKAEWYKHPSELPEYNELPIK
ncbi:MAG: GFA family protein [bacterium]|nr:GFA family protein [bacterium]